MRLKCFHCGKNCSTEVPNGTIVRGIIECPECVEKLGPAPDAIEDIVKSAYKRGFADGMESTAETAREILGIGAAPEPDAVEIVDKLEKLLNMDQAIFPPQSSYSEAAALIESYGRRVPRAMLEFPRQPNKKDGWTIEYSCLEQAWEVIRENEYCSYISMEQVEAMLIFVEKRMKTEADKHGYKVEG